MKARLIASGVAALAVASVGVPMALSGPASAKSTAAPTLTACTPAPAIVGKTVTVTGTGLRHATVTVGTAAVAKLGHDSAKTIKFKVPKGIKTPKTGTAVKVTTPNGAASLKCTFKSAPKK